MSENIIVIIIIVFVIGRWGIQLSDSLMDLFYSWLSKYHVSNQIVIGKMQKEHEEELELMQKRHEEEMSANEDQSPCIGFEYPQTEESSFYDEDE